MIEVKCNGKIYRFPEWESEIIDRLDMTAVEVTDDPDDKPDFNKKVYTRDAAALILEKFENLLDAKDISIPCADPDEQAELDGEPENNARIYGTEYSDLLDSVEAEIADIAETARAGAMIVKDEFSGTI